MYAETKSFVFPIPMRENREAVEQQNYTESDEAKPCRIKSTFSSKPQLLPFDTLNFKRFIKPNIRQTIADQVQRHAIATIDWNHSNTVEPPAEMVMYVNPPIAPVARTQQYGFPCLFTRKKMEGA
jgi:hypothetical protein